MNKNKTIKPIKYQEFLLIPEDASGSYSFISNSKKMNNINNIMQ